MATRSLVVAEGEIGAYHCMARCVRRALLCGKDPSSKRSYDHRKDWLQMRLRDIASGFAIDIGSYAIMSNHIHIVLKTRPDLTENWDAEEITRRWRIIFPMLGKPPSVRKAIIEMEIKNKKLVESRRRRLSSVSWFMRTLLEPVARKANREDGCTGRFWEERFKCVGLLDDLAVLACSTYVDLNPIRAGLCKTPEQSEYTSVFDRIKQRQEQRPESLAADNWLSPISTKERRTPTSRRASQTAWLDMALDEYLELLDWTGRQSREDKPGSIPENIAPILDRLKIQSRGWLLFTRQFGELFTRWAGSPEKLEERARQKGRTRIHGLAASKDVYE